MIVLLKCMILRGLDTKITNWLLRNWLKSGLFESVDVGERLTEWLTHSNGLCGLVISYFLCLVLPVIADARTDLMQCCGYDATRKLCRPFLGQSLPTHEQIP